MNWQFRQIYQEFLNGNLTTDSVAEEFLEIMKEYEEEKEKDGER